MFVSLLVILLFFFFIKNDLVIGKQYQQSKHSQVAEGELCTGSSAVISDLRNAEQSAFQSGLALWVIPASHGQCV